MLSVGNSGNGNGGTITVTAAGFTGLSSQVLYLGAGSGSNGGNGGTINVTTLSGTSTGDIVVGDASLNTGLEFDDGVFGNGVTGKWWHCKYIFTGNNLTVVPTNAYIDVGPFCRGYW